MTDFQPAITLRLGLSATRKYGGQLAAALGERGIIAELGASNRVAEWAYAQTEAAHGLTWLRADEMVPLAAGWRGLLESYSRDPHPV